MSIGRKTKAAKREASKCEKKDCRRGTCCDDEWFFNHEKKKRPIPIESDANNVIETCGPPPAKRIRLISAECDLNEVGKVTSGSSTAKKKRAILIESDVSVQTRGPPPANKIRLISSETDSNVVSRSGPFTTI